MSIQLWNNYSTDLILPLTSMRAQIYQGWMLLKNLTFSVSENTCSFQILTSPDTLRNYHEDLW